MPISVVSILWIYNVKTNILIILKFDSNMITIYFSKR